MADIVNAFLVTAVKGAANKNVTEGLKQFNDILSNVISLLDVGKDSIEEAMKFIHTNAFKVSEKDYRKVMKYLAIALEDQNDLRIRGEAFIAYLYKIHVIDKEELLALSKKFTEELYQAAREASHMAAKATTEVSAQAMLRKEEKEGGEARISLKDMDDLKVAVSQGFSSAFSAIASALNGESEDGSVDLTPLKDGASAMGKTLAHGATFVGSSSSAPSMGFGMSSEGEATTFEPFHFNTPRILRTLYQLSPAVKEAVSNAPQLYRNIKLTKEAVDQTQTVVAKAQEVINPLKVWVKEHKCVFTGIDPIAMVEFEEFKEDLKGELKDVSDTLKKGGSRLLEAVVDRGGHTMRFTQQASTGFFAFMKSQFIEPAQSFLEQTTTVAQKAAVETEEKIRHRLQTRLHNQQELLANYDASIKSLDENLNRVHEVLVRVGDMIEAVRTQQSTASTGKSKGSKGPKSQEAPRMQLDANTAQQIRQIIYTLGAREFNIGTLLDMIRREREANHALLDHIGGMKKALLAQGGEDSTKFKVASEELRAELDTRKHGFFDIIQLIADIKSDYLQSMIINKFSEVDKDKPSTGSGAK